ncbi:MAG TPA: IS3 family transposase [Terrimicrobiaceae bacterium]
MLLAGIIDQNVEPSKFAHSILDQLFAELLISDVARKRNGFSTRRPNEFDCIPLSFLAPDLRPPVQMFVVQLTDFLHAFHESRKVLKIGSFAESFFASLKAECLPPNGIFDSFEEANLALFDYLETFYNRSRRHSSLGHLSPKAFLNLFFQNQKTNLN